MVCNRRPAIDFVEAFEIALCYEQSGRSSPHVLSYFLPSRRPSLHVYRKSLQSSAGAPTVLMRHGCPTCRPCRRRHRNRMWCRCVSSAPCAASTVCQSDERFLRCLREWLTFGARSADVRRRSQRSIKLSVSDGQQMNMTIKTCVTLV